MSEPIIELRAINKNYYSKEKGGLFFGLNSKRQLMP